MSLSIIFEDQLANCSKLEGRTDRRHIFQVDMVGCTDWMPLNADQVCGWGSVQVLWKIHQTMFWMHQLHCDTESSHGSQLEANATGIQHHWYGYWVTQCCECAAMSSMFIDSVSNQMTLYSTYLLDIHRTSLMVSVHTIMIGWQMIGRIRGTVWR